MPGKKKEESVKEIMTILEDYKSAFPIKIEKNNYQKFQKFLYKEMMKENKLQVMFF